MPGYAGPLRVFVEGDGDVSAIAGRRIAIIGYGNQGRAQALNLRDSGAGDIVVATADDDTARQARADGFALAPVRDAVRSARIVMLLVPDEELPALFEREIAPALAPGAAIVVASGYNLAFGGIQAPDHADVLLLAPRMVGERMRELYVRGEPFYSYVAVEQDATGEAWPVLLGMAAGIGTLRGGAFELAAAQEALLDLFHEQAFGSLIGIAFTLMLEAGREAGLPDEAMVLDFYLSGEMAETFRAMAELGFVEQARLHSRTSQYGGMMRALALDREPLRQHFRAIIEDIRSGEFARRWAAEEASGAESFERMRELARAANPFTPVERRIRDATRRSRP